MDVSLRLKCSLSRVVIMILWFGDLCVSGYVFMLSVYAIDRFSMS